MKSKQLGRPKGVTKIQVATKLMPHTVDTLNRLVAETGRSKNNIIDLAIDLACNSIIKNDLAIDKKYDKESTSG